MGLHLSLVVTVSLQDISATLASGSRLSPNWVEPFLHRTEAVTSAILGRQSGASDAQRQILATYADCTGIEAGYSYFAPNVPGNSKLVFELHYPDGRVEYDVPVVGGEAAGYRVSTLLDHLRAVQYVRLREALLETLVYSIHREHPEAMLIRAFFGVADLTTPSEYRAGKRISYQAVYAYDFRFGAAARPSTVR